MKKGLYQNLFPFLITLLIGCTPNLQPTPFPGETNTKTSFITEAASTLTETLQATNNSITTETQEPQTTSVSTINLSNLKPITSSNIHQLEKLIEFTPTGVSGNGNINSVTLSPSGKYLGYFDYTAEHINLWDIEIQSIIHVYSWMNDESPCCVMNECSQAGPVFNQDETKIAMVNNQGIHVWNIDSEILQTDQNPCTNEDLISPQPVYTTLVFSPDGKKLFSGSAFAGAKFTIWDAKNGNLLSQSSAYGNAIWDLFLSENNQYLISRDSGAHLSFYDPYSGLEIMVPPNLKNEEFRGIVCPQSSADVSVSPDGQTLAVLCNVNTSPEMIFPECAILSGEADPQLLLNCDYLQLINSQTWERNDPFNDLRHKTGGVTFNQDGSLIVYGTNQSEITVEFLDSQTQYPLFQLNQFNNPSKSLISLQFSANGRIFVIQFSDGQIQIWGIKT